MLELLRRLGFQAPEALDDLSEQVCESIPHAFHPTPESLFGYQNLKGSGAAGTRTRYGKSELRAGHALAVAVRPKPYPPQDIPPSQRSFYAAHSIRVDFVSPGLLGLILAASVASHAVTAALAARSVPSRLNASVSRMLADVEDVRHEWEVSKLQLTQLIEGLDDIHDRVKRAKAGNRAIQQRIEMTPNGGNPDDHRQELRRRAGIIQDLGG